MNVLRIVKTNTNVFLMFNDLEKCMTNVISADDLEKSMTNVISAENVIFPFFNLYFLNFLQYNPPENLFLCVTQAPIERGVRRL